VAPKLVLTGFGHFPGVPDNPTQAIVEAFRKDPNGLAQPHKLALLDVAYRSAGSMVDALLDPAPDALVLTGYSNRATMVTLEARATDYCAPDQPDICGTIPPLKSDPAPPLTTSAPLASLSIALKEASIAAEISQDAGAYLCNYTYRHALERVNERALDTTVLFVHLPALEGTELAKDAAGTISMADAKRAVCLIGTMLTSKG